MAVHLQRPAESSSASARAWWRPASPRPTRPMWSAMMAVYTWLGSSLLRGLLTRSAESWAKGVHDPPTRILHGQERDLESRESPGTNAGQRGTFAGMRTVLRCGGASNATGLLTIVGIGVVIGAGCGRTDAVL